MDVGGLQVAASVQEQLGNVGAAGEGRPVEADVLFLSERPHTHMLNLSRHVKDTKLNLRSSTASQPKAGWKSSA